MARLEWDAVVVGGGFFGASLALLLKEALPSVLVLEREPHLMGRASYHNQARVHGGYHYPRSLMTAVRSRINFPRFLEDFTECIVDNFESYYAVATRFSKVSARQYSLFMQRAGAPLRPAPARFVRLFNPGLIEAVFAVRECAFDAALLRRALSTRLAEAGIPVRCETEATSAERLTEVGYKLHVSGPAGPEAFTARWVFNCTYSGLNRLRQQSQLPLLSVKHELAEMALVEPPSELGGAAITVMCGPFFSLMPFPPRGLWTLSHVRYTPQGAWHDQAGAPLRQTEPSLPAARPSMGPLMICDAARYLPAMRQCRQRDSLWEIKTTLPQTELDDGRPILFHHDPRQPGFVTVMGGKLDNVYDLPHDLAALGLAPTGALSP